MTDNIEQQRAARIEALEAEYERRFREIGRYLTSYSSGIRYLFVFGSLIVSLVTWVTSIDLSRIPLNEDQIALAAAVSIIVLTLALLYMDSYIHTSLFRLHVAGTYSRHLEDRLNKELKQDIYLWESSVNPWILGRGLRFTGLYVHPNWLMAIYNGFVILAVVVIMLLAWRALVGKWLIAFAVAAATFFIHHAWRWYFLIRRVVPFLYERISAVSHGKELAYGE